METLTFMYQTFADLRGGAKSCAYESERVNVSQEVRGLTAPPRNLVAYTRRKIAENQNLS